MRSPGRSVAPPRAVAGAASNAPGNIESPRAGGPEGAGLAAYPTAAASAAPKGDHVAVRPKAKPCKFPTGSAAAKAASSAAQGGRPRATQVNGYLDPATIQEIVRSHFDRFRSCYEDGLRRDPNLSGRISTKFVVNLDGSVDCASSADMTFADADVVACVVDGFSTLHFPPPKGGICTVVYPIQFYPGD
jgi:hypothetical protein